MADDQAAPHNLPGGAPAHNPPQVPKTAASLSEDASAASPHAFPAAPNAVASLSEAASAVLERVERARKSRAASKDKRPSLMVTHYIAPGRKRKEFDTLVEHEKGKVRRAVLTEDAKRQKYPEKYADVEMHDNELIMRLVTRFPHVTEQSMRLHIDRIRAEHKETDSMDKPNPEAIVLELKAKITALQEALKIETGRNEALHEVELEKKRAEDQVLELRREMRAMNEVAKATHRQLDKMTSDYAALKQSFMVNEERTRQIEEDLRLTQANLEKAKSDGSDVTTLIHERDELKLHLWAFQKEFKATQDRAERMDKERDQALALVVREKEKLAETLKVMKTQLERAGGENDVIVKQLQAKDETLQKQAAELEALKAVEEHLKRCQYIWDIGPLFESKMKAIAETFHSSLWQDFEQEARLIYGRKEEHPAVSIPRLVQITTAMKRAVAGDHVQVSAFSKTMSVWKNIRNEVCHRPKSYLPYAEKNYFESLRKDLDRVGSALDQYDGLLRSPRDQPDRQRFVHTVACILTNKRV